MISVRLKEENEAYFRELLDVEMRSANYVMNRLVEEFRKRNPIVNGRLQLNPNIFESKNTYEVTLGDEVVGTISLAENGSLSFNLDSTKLVPVPLVV